MVYSHWAHFAQQFMGGVGLEGGALKIQCLALSGLLTFVKQDSFVIVREAEQENFMLHETYWPC